MSTYHTTVLLNEAVEALNIRPEGTYVDATFGGGGHSQLILRGLGDKGKLIGFDQDDDARTQLIEDKRFMFLNHNFRDMKRMLKFSVIRRVDGVLADLGVSSHQFDEADRGFSYRFDAPLDMRMNQAEGATAAKILNTYTAENLQKILSEQSKEALKWTVFLPSMKPSLTPN